MALAMVILEVSQLNRYVRSLLEGEEKLSEVYVRGELSNIRGYQRGGHLYFTLKDREASVRAVMFSSQVARLSFLPQDGLSVLARGAATLYERDGSFQLRVSELLLDGAGALGRAFEQRKQALAAEGLFDAARKRPIPQIPSVIGVVTSPTGAALQDIISVLGRRCPMVTLLLAPALVQGKDAADSIAQAISLLNNDGRSDVLIVGRGGGSAEELWAFNEETTVRAVALSKIPVISAVGHETDITLCDFAADLRAATPTAAAELAVIDISVLREQLAVRGERIKEAAVCALLQKNNRLLTLRSALGTDKLYFILNKNRQRLELLIKSIYNLSIAGHERYVHQLKTHAALLESLSPLRVLARGYSITEKNGHPIASVKDAALGEQIVTHLSDGVLYSAVTQVQQGEKI